MDWAGAAIPDVAQYRGKIMPLLFAVTSETGLPSGILQVRGIQFYAALPPTLTGARSERDVNLVADFAKNMGAGIYGVTERPSTMEAGQRTDNVHWIRSNGKIDQTKNNLLQAPKMNQLIC